MAADWGLWSIVDYLIDKGADLNIIDDSGHSAVTVAYQNSIEFLHCDAVYKLIDAGADINAGGNMNCLLIQAVQNSDIRLLRKLLLKPNIIIPTFAGYNPVRNCDYLVTEKEIQRIFEEGYPIATRTRCKKDNYQWRTLLRK
jgi:ankyrin repeat protein